MSELGPVGEGRRDEKRVFLVNPASANGSTGKRWPELAQRAAAVGLTGDAVFSERQGHLAELAREAALAGADLLVVVGGDGSVNEVTNGLVGIDRAPELALIPRGTGWDFSRTFAVPRGIEEAARVALDGATRVLDVGRVTYRAWSGSDGEAYFANVASAGMGGAVAQRANETTKALGGKTSYLLATLAVFARWKAPVVRLAVDGEEREATMHEVVVANAKYLGGGMMMCPEAEPDDGLFDVLALGDLTKLDLARSMPKLYKGTHLPHPKAELLRGKVVSIDSDTPIPIQLDGEQPGRTPATFEIVPGRLRLRVPA
ncbi:MAG: diacylglycerol kinase family protein [Gaiellales bacterium]